MKNGCREFDRKAAEEKLSIAGISLPACAEDCHNTYV